MSQPDSSLEGNDTCRKVCAHEHFERYGMIILGETRQDDELVIGTSWGQTEGPRCGANLSGKPACML